MEAKASVFASIDMNVQDYENKEKIKGMFELYKSTGMFPIDNINTTTWADFYNLHFICLGLAVYHEKIRSEGLEKALKKSQKRIERFVFYGTTGDMEPRLEFLHKRNTHDS